MRRLLISIVAICLVAFGVFAFANRPVPAGGDDIIIKGGSMTIQCGANHGKDCLVHADGTDLYTHKKDVKITHVLVTIDGTTKLLDRDIDKDHQPTITVTYK